MRKVTIQRVLSPNSQLWQNAKTTAASFSSNVWDKNKDHIGIDVGSRCIRVAVMEGNNNPKVIHTGTSAVCMTAKSVQGKINPVDNIYGFKNLIKRDYNDPLVKKEMERVTYKIVKAPNGDAGIETSYGQLVPPTFVYQSILEHVKKNAEMYLGKKVSRAVIAYPSVFNEDQLREIVKAAFGAGFQLIHTIDEPTAAAIAYGMNNKEEGRRFVVIDIGARTFDVSILEVSSNGRFSLKKPTKSDMFFGGSDFDDVLAEYIRGVFDCSDQAREGIKENVELYQMLRSLSESRKIELSSSFETTIKVPFFGPHGEVVRYFVNELLTRTKFESMVNHLIERIKNQIESYLIEADISPKDIDEVLLVGGMARVPKVRKVVAAICGKIPCRSLTNPDEAVALGAAAAVHAGHFGQDAWND
ncbi:hypothetical protein ACHQM5_003662 [Ranunculus cassubicifolius]